MGDCSGRHHAVRRRRARIPARGRARGEGRPSDGTRDDAAAPRPRGDRGSPPAGERPRRARERRRRTSAGDVDETRRATRCDPAAAPPAGHDTDRLRGLACRAQQQRRALRPGQGPPGHHPRPRHRPSRAARPQRPPGSSASPTRLRSQPRPRPLHRIVTAALAVGWYDQIDLFGPRPRRLGARTAGRLSVRAVLYLPQQLSLAEAGFASALAYGGETPVIAGLTGVRRADRAVEESLARIGRHPCRRAAAARASRASHVLHASDSDDEIRCVVRDVVAAAAHARHLAAPGRGPLRRPPSRTPGCCTSTSPPRASPSTARAPGPVIERAIASALPRHPEAGRRPTCRARRSLHRRVRSAHPDVRRATASPRRDGSGSRAAPPSSAAPTGRPAWTSSGRRPGPTWRPRRPVTTRRRPGPTGYRRDIESVDGLQGFALWLQAELTSAQALDDVGGPERLGGRAVQRPSTATPGRWPSCRPRSSTPPSSWSPRCAGWPSSGPSSRAPVSTGSSTPSCAGLEAALPRVGRFGEGVLVAPLSAAIGLDVDAVFVVGLAEDSYPGPAGRGRAAARPGPRPQRRRAGVVPRPARRKHRHLLAAFDARPAWSWRRSPRRPAPQHPIGCRADGCCRRCASSTGDREPRGDRVGVGRRSADIRSSPSFAALVDDARRCPPREQEWRTQAAVARAPRRRRGRHAGLALIRARAGDAFSRFDGNLLGSDGLPGLRRRRPAGLPDGPGGLRRPVRTPTSSQRLLGVEPARAARGDHLTISPLDIGNLIHQTMDTFVTELDGVAARLRRAVERSGSAPGSRRSPREGRGVRAARHDRSPRAVAAPSATASSPTSTTCSTTTTGTAGSAIARVLTSELTFGMGGAEPVAVQVAQRHGADARQRRQGRPDAATAPCSSIDIKTAAASGPSRRSGTIRSPPAPSCSCPSTPRPPASCWAAERAEAAYWFVRQDRELDRRWS